MISIEQFPLIQADSKAAVRLRKLLDILNPALEADSILNPNFIDAKYHLNQITEMLFFCNGLYYNYDLSFTSSSHANNRIKLAEKKFSEQTVFIAAAKEIKLLHEALQSLKSKVVKRQIRSEEERAADYVPPIPSTAAATLVYNVLKRMTDPLTKQFADILYGMYLHAVEYEIAHPILRSDKRWLRHIPGRHVHLVGEDYDSLNGLYRALKPDYKETIRNIADQDAGHTQRVFLYKNVMKLATIIERKNNLEGEPKVFNAKVNPAGHGFSGEVLFHFADGSNFTVRNKVVYKQSVHGRDFTQYPTTFHNALLPFGQGVMPGQPSEEEMIEIFATAAKK